MLVFQGWISPCLKCEDRSSGWLSERTGTVMLTSSHAKKDKRQKGTGTCTEENWPVPGQPFSTGKSFPLEPICCYGKKTKYPLSLWEFLSSLKGLQIWENFFPLLSTCTYDVSKILLSLLSQGISQLSLIIRHIFIHGLWGLTSTFWTTEYNPKNWILNFSPRKEDKSFIGSWTSKWVQTSVNSGQPGLSLFVYKENLWLYN